MERTVERPAVSVRIDVLGPLRAEVSGSPADLGGRRRRALLARLAVAGGRVVSADALVEDLWPTESAPRALAALQVNVSHLRRVLEPDRPPRGAATVVVSSPPGYALRLGPDDLDSRRFERLIDTAAGAAPAGAEELLVEAIGLWSGAALAEFAAEPWAAPEAARLEELRLVAVERLGAARLAGGRSGAAVADLERHVHDHPLREGAVALLVTALYQDGRQAEALAVLTRTRRLLADELGVDPGPELRGLEHDVLAHAPPIRAPQAAPPAPTQPQPDRADPPDVRTAPPAPALVGRAPDLARLRAAGEQPGGCRLVLVSGDAGAGKSALVEAFRADRAAAGWTTAVGRCPEVDGAPVAWAWRELVDALLTDRPVDDGLVERLAPLRGTGPTSADRTFWLAQAVTELLAAVAAAGPVLVVLDDLHRAEDETLQLLRSVVTGLPAAPVLVVATLRPAEVTADVETTLAALAAPITDRIALEGLGEPAVRELLGRQGAGDVGADVVALVTERTGGNPLFVRELARLIATEGAAAAAEQVPSGVRDVLRRRVERLPGAARTVLRQAAVLGRDVEIDVLERLAGGGTPDGEDAVLDALEMGVLSGLLTEPRAGWVRFAHALVRDTLYRDVPRLRRTRLHAAALAALVGARPGDLAALAHHALSAGPAVPPGQALGHVAAAAREAGRSGAHRDAARLWGAGVELCGPAAAGAERETELRIAHASALAHSGDTRAAVGARRAAVDHARGGALLDRALTCYDVPVAWTIRPDQQVDADLVALLEERLAAPDPDLAMRCRLLAALVFELESRDDQRVRTASAEALRISAELGDPRLRCLALNARGLIATGPDLAHELGALGAEMLATAQAAGLVGYRSQAHHLLFQAALSRHDLDGAQRHADAAVVEASGGQLGQMLGWTAIYAGLRALIGGDTDTADAVYTSVGERLVAAGESNGALLGLIGQIGVRHATGRLGEFAELLVQVVAPIPQGPSDLVVLALLAAGEPERARAMWRPEDPYSLNYYWVLFTALRAEVAVGFGDREMAAACYEQLLPWQHTLAGLASGTVTVGPVAHVLADLAELLGMAPDVREAHLARALEVSRELGAPLWERRARTALDAVAPEGQPKTSSSRRR